MSDKIKLKDALSIGIGGMVGGGIFAVLGLAVSLAQGGTPIAFLIAGLLALITSYSYAKLSLTFPERGGKLHYHAITLRVCFWVLRTKSIYDCKRIRCLSHLRKCCYYWRHYYKLLQYKNCRKN